MFLARNEFDDADLGLQGLGEVPSPSKPGGSLD